jgi:lysophospholipase L1-like esterase
MKPKIHVKGGGRTMLSQEARALLLLWWIFGALVPGFAAEIPVPAAPLNSSSARDQADACAKAAKEQVFHDMADFAHYAALDAALPPPGPRERRVVFTGDSITEFWATLDAQFFARPDFIDRGISGQTTPQILLRFRQDVIALKPAVVHILAGINDIAGNAGPMDLPATEANIASMVDLARVNGIQVVIGSVLPAAEFPWKPGLNPGPKVVALNQWLKNYSAARHLLYVDYYAAMTDGALGMRSDLTQDGVHPTQAGYRIMNPLAEAAIRAALSRPGKSQ